jgi:chorismate mutase
MSTTTITSLDEARDRIDEIDRRFVELLAKRYAVVDEICEMKAEDGDNVKDPDREAELLDHVASIAEENDLSPDLVRRLYDEILSHSVRRQRKRRGTSTGEEAASACSEATSLSASGPSSNGRDHT